MKRIGNLITEETITIDFCKQAIYNAAKNKTRRTNVMKVLMCIDDKARELQAIILNETYRPAPTTHEIRLENGKERYLTKCRYFPDQCIHHVLVMLVKDKLEKRLDPLAVASIPNRGQGLAQKAIENVLNVSRKRKKATYCGKGDIKHCFESVKPHVVMRCICRIVKDIKYIRLMSKVIYSCNSLPLGNYTSAWILNILLKDFDNRIREQDGVIFYVRYMDDFLFISPNKRKARRLREIIIKELAKLELELKPNYQLFRIIDRGIDMIGYRFFKNNTILRKRNLKKIYRQIRIMSKQKYYKVHDCLSIMSRLGMCRHCNSKYIWRLAGQQVDLYKVKNIIREASRLYSYTMNGKEYKPKMLLL